MELKVQLAKQKVQKSASFQLFLWSVYSLDFSITVSLGFLFIFCVDVPLPD